MAICVHIYIGHGGDDLDLPMHTHTTLSCAVSARIALEPGNASSRLRACSRNFFQTLVVQLQRTIVGRIGSVNMNLSVSRSRTDVSKDEADTAFFWDIVHVFKIGGLPTIGIS